MRVVGVVKKRVVCSSFGDLNWIGFYSYPESVEGLSQSSTKNHIKCRINHKLTIIYLLTDKLMKIRIYFLPGLCWSFHTHENF